MKTNLRRKPVLAGLIAITTFLFSTLTSVSTASPRNSSIPDSSDENFLELRGVITGARSYLQEAEILVYEEDGSSLYITDLTNRMGRSTIRLPLNRQFTIVISKSGFVSKSLLINTHRPDSGKYTQTFKYSVELYEAISGLDNELFRKPIAQVFYSAEKKCFAFDEDYTASMAEQLRQVYENYFTKVTAAPEK